MSDPCIKVAIIDDDDWLRQSLARRIADSPGFAWIGGYRSVTEALDAIPMNPPDVLLMDINLPEMDGVEGVRRLKTVRPSIQVLMLTVYEEGQRVFDSLLAGASGYLLKRTSHQELLEAIQDVMKGGSPMTGSVARKVVQYFN